MCQLVRGLELGMWLDSELSLKQHVAKVASACLRPPYGRLLEFRRSKLGWLKCRPPPTFYAKNFIRKLFQPFQRNLLMKCVPKPKIEKILLF